MTDQALARRRLDWRRAPHDASRQLGHAWRAASPRRRIGLSLALLLVAALVVLLILFDWNWLRGPVSRIASAALNREVRIEGDLDVHPWSFSPRAEAAGVRIANPAWAVEKGDPKDMAAVGKLAVQVKILPLLKGDVILPLLQIDSPNVGLLREKDGRANWTFGDPDKPKRDKPLKLPAIQHFIINDGQLRIEDRDREITFEGTVTSNEQATGSGKGAFRLEGQGRLNRAPFTALVTGGPLLNVSPDRPYPFEAHVRGGSSSLDAVGQVNKPFDLGRFGGQVALAGPDLNELYRLTGLALPNTPPYRIAGRLERDGTLWSLNNFTGRVGDSDINGDLSVQTGRTRPLLTADVRSRKLDFDDLSTILGGAPSRRAGETASPGQKAVGAQMAANQRLLPDATLQVDRLRSMDAEVKYRAADILAPGLPMQKASLDLSLKAGVLTMHPVAFTFSRGSLVADVRLDATKATPVTDLDARLTNARLEDFIAIKNTAGQPAVEGVIAARAKLVGSGNSVHRTAASSNGTVTAVIPRGQIRQAFAELLGVNASKGLILLLSKDNRETSLRCAVADFKVTDGVMRANRIVLDTGVVLASGSGVINLEDETLDLRIEGDSKRPRLVRLFVPININGSLAKPGFGLDTGAVVAQGGLAAALGSLLSPIAALLPFVDPGLADDADCAALVGSAKTKGAPVTTRTTAAEEPKKRPG